MFGEFKRFTIENCQLSLTITAKRGAHARKIDRWVQVNLYRVI